MITLAIYLAFWRPSPRIWAITGSLILLVNPHPFSPFLIRSVPHLYSLRSVSILPFSICLSCFICSMYTCVLAALSPQSLHVDYPPYTTYLLLISVPLCDKAYKQQMILIRQSCPVMYRTTRRERWSKEKDRCLFDQDFPTPSPSRQYSTFSIWARVTQVR